MRGRSRAVVGALLVGSGASSGALVGWLVGLPWLIAGLPPMPVPAAVALLGAALAGDVAGRRWPAASPPSVRRQVPRAWGRLFGAHGAAVLYGARLGVGPLTILRSWLWWAGTAVLATTGPWWSGAGGGAFGLVFLTAVVAVSGRLGASGAPSAATIARLRSAEPAALAASTVVLVAVGVLALAGG